MKQKSLLVWIALLSVLAASLACGLPDPYTQIKATVAPIRICSDLGQVDLCQAIPKEDIEAAMGRKLIAAPERFEYYDTAGTSGCSYDAGKDSSGNAHFGYVVLTPVEVYNTQPLYLNTEVDNIGQEAYFNNGADARQLWVKVNDNLAFVVAFGDQPIEEGAKAIARLTLAAIILP